jgi:hypothetical protein
MTIVTSGFARRSVVDRSSSARWQASAGAANRSGPWYLARISGETRSSASW